MRVAIKTKIKIIENKELNIFSLAPSSVNEPNNELEIDIIAKIRAASIPALRTSVNGESILVLKNG
jgi:hypothetical protein